MNDRLFSFGLTDLEFCCTHYFPPALMRNSILSRPLRPPSRINDESSETQLQRDERLLRARRERAAIIDENMRHLHLADKADIETKLKLFEENKNCFEEHQQFSAEAEAAKRAYEEKLRVEVRDREQQELARAANSNERKKAEARSFMEENKRLAEEKHKRQLEEKARDQSLDRENIAVQAIAFSQRRLR